jgi:hypothetical protein
MHLEFFCNKGAKNLMLHAVCENCSAKRAVVMVANEIHVKTGTLKAVTSQFGCARYTETILRIKTIATISIATTITTILMSTAKSDLAQI